MVFRCGQPLQEKLYVNRLYKSFQKTSLEMISRGGLFMPTISENQFLEMGREISCIQHR
jgi:hypothetical protein